ncbi:MAG: proline dehydrogenase, partial [Terriglobia bacterium]
MAFVRDVLLRASQSRWLMERAPKYRFVRRTASRFVPGETVEEALTAASDLQRHSIGTLLTYLGENVTGEGEAERVTLHYLGVLDRIRAMGVNAELSVKLTQLGLDLDPQLAFDNLMRIVRSAGLGSVVWIDMEAGPYVERT